MKLKIQNCRKCNEETNQDVGKKQATSSRGGYTRRKTARCRRCGTREITNMRRGTRTISGKNLKGEEK